MLKNQPCFVKDACVHQGTAIDNNVPALERAVFNEALKVQGQKELFNDTDSQIYNENGVVLDLFCPETEHTYRRFLPASWLQEMMGEGYSDLTIDDLSFFAEQIKKRTSPMFITVFGNEVEGGEYQNAQAASKNGEVKFKTIGKKSNRRSKKGKR